MRYILALSATLLLSGCSPAQFAADVRVAHKLTVEDLARYVDENHAWRREVRSLRYDIVRESVRTLMVHASAAHARGNVSLAISLRAEADRLLLESYPPLATLKLTKEQLEALDEMRPLWNGAEDAPPTKPKAGISQ